MTDALAAIVVAVDLAGSANDAVEWAAAEAAERGLGLRIVHVLPAPRAFDPGGLEAWEHLAATTTAADQVLREAADRSRGVAPEVSLSTAVLHGPPGWALEQVAHGAPLLVLGSRGRSASQRFLCGSVSGHLAARAPCPVVVVRHQEHPVAGAPVVVCGLVPGAAGLVAAGFAFQAAWQRRVPLRLVHVDPQAVAAAPDPTIDPALARAIERWRQSFSGIRVTTSTPAGDPAAILLAASAGSALLVLASAGSRRRGARHLTSIGQRLLPKACCPVAVVGHMGADEPRRGRAPALQSRSPAETRNDC